jgi:tRNA(Ile)-lysidine synthase
VDHNTRNGLSTRDAEFVEKYCNDHKLLFHKTTFTHDSNTGGNFHKVAHDFRYKFFESLGYDYILTAHHQDDHIESIMLNFLNGKSIEGIAESNGNIVRPLMPYSKEAIRKYAMDNKVPFVEDSSNHTDAFDRNYIRNIVLPILTEKFDHVTEKLTNLVIRHQEDNTLFESLIKSNLSYKQTKNGVSLNADQFDNNPTLLYHSIKEFGFNRDQANNVIRAQDNTGSLFYSNTHTLLIDRQKILIAPIQENIKNDDASISITLSDIPSEIKFLDVLLHFEKVNQIDDQAKNIVYIPLELLNNKLLIRTWREGDYFYPFGMNGQKKTLKKFFADSHINRIDKHRIPLLIHNDEIVWIANHRSDERYRYTDTVMEFVKVTLSL